MTDKATVFIINAIQSIDPEISRNVEADYNFAVGAIELAQEIGVITPKLAGLLEEVAAHKKWEADNIK